MDTKINRIAGMAALTLGLVLVAYSKPAAAAHSGGSIAVQFGGGECYAPAVERRMTQGHYEVRCETVLVEPERHERRWVPARYETRWDPCGHPHQVLVSEGHYRTAWVPARYETREVRVWVPGCYEDVPVAAYRHSQRPRFSVRGFFGF